MLLVKTYLAQSSINGIGLFAAQDIPPNTVMWELNPAIDITLSKEQLNSLSQAAYEQVVKYAYIEINTNKIILCGDDARFFNHSDNSNCYDIQDEFGGKTISKKYINAGEELTCDYRLFCHDFNGF